MVHYSAPCIMKRALLFSLIAASMPWMLGSCAEPETKPVGPTSDTSKIPWNRPIAGQGQGQMGMLPQNMYRR